MLAILFLFTIFALLFSFVVYASCHPSFY